MIVSSGNVQWGGKTAFDGQLKKGTSLTDLVLMIEYFLQMLMKGYSLECLELSKFGIQCKPEENQNVLCLVFEQLLTSYGTANQQISSLLSAFQQFQQTSNIIKDERVKVTETSTQAKYLEATVSSVPGKIVYDKTNDVLEFKGFVPIGTTAMINRKRLPDFDNKGKGKDNTDLKGWHIRNGEGGTENVLGRISMYTDTLENAGKKSGSNKITIDQTNLPSLEFGVTGTIGSALGPVTFRVPFVKISKILSLIGTARDILTADPGGNVYKSADPQDFTHNHSFDLKSKFDNPQPAEISIIPEHIKEIPIEFIGY